MPPPQAERIAAPASPDASAPVAFLSYAREDREAVDKLAEQLQANGIRVWQDVQNLQAGDNWNEILRSIIKEKVQYVIVVQTITMTTASRGVFHREIEIAREALKEMGYFEGQRLRFLIPVTIGHCRLLPSLKDLHATDVSDSRGVDQLVTAIKEDWEKREKLRALQESPA